MLMGFMEKILIVRLEYIENIMTTEAIHKYLKLQNRPLSIHDLVSSLDKEKYNKTIIQKSLDKLLDSGKIFVKTYGKQKIYCIIQESIQNLEELKRIERELQTHSNEQLKKLQELESELRTQESIFNSLTCNMSFEEAQEEHNRLQNNIKTLSIKLDELMETSGIEDMSEVKKKAEKGFNVYNREYTKRKQICNDILDCILENYPGSKKQLHTEIGINAV